MIREKISIVVSGKDRIESRRQQASKLCTSRIGNGQHRVAAGEQLYFPWTIMKV